MQEPKPCKTNEPDFFPKWMKGEHTAETPTAGQDAETRRIEFQNEVHRVFTDEIDSLRAQLAALREENERLKGEAVSLRVAADRPLESVSLIHQYDAKACCDKLDSLRAELEESKVDLDRVRNAALAVNIERDRLREENAEQAKALKAMLSATCGNHTEMSAAKRLARSALARTTIPPEGNSSPA